MDVTRTAPAAASGGTGARDAAPSVAYAYNLEAVSLWRTTPFTAAAFRRFSDLMTTRHGLDCESTHGLTWTRSGSTPSSSATICAIAVG